MMTLDPDDQFFQEDNDSHSLDDDIKNTKDAQIYKDTMSLLKRKMGTAQDLLEQFNHKVKENNALNIELYELKHEKEKLFNKYNTASEKLTRLELTNRDYEKSRNDYKNICDKQKLKLDEKRKHMEQLEFKIKEMEKDSFRLKDEIKRLQQENKISLSVAKKITKSKASQTICTQDASIMKKPQMRDEITMTDLADDQPITLICTECQQKSKIPSLKKILKIMTAPPPPCITNELSPPCSPRSMPSSKNQTESIASNTCEQRFQENPESNNFDEKTISENQETIKESDRPSFMLIDKLTRKINKMERLIKKKKKKQDNRQMCCSSKNIKFVVQLPSQEKYFEYAKLERKQARLKRLNKKQVKLKNNDRFLTKEWLVENDISNKNMCSNDGFQTSCKEFNVSLNKLEKVNNDKSNDLNNKNPNDSDENMVCKNIKQGEANDQALVLHTNSKMDNQENYSEIQSTSSNNRKDSISSTSSSEYDELFAASPISLSPRPSDLQNIKYEYNQKNIQEPNSGNENIDLPSNTNDSMEKQMNFDDEMYESTEDNDNSDDSLSLRYSANKKRGKRSNIIESDDSFESLSNVLDKNRRRKTLIVQRKQLLTKLNKLKNHNNQPTTSKEMEKPSESISDHSDIYIPVKKQRIAHVPKNNSEINSESVIQLKTNICKAQKEVAENVPNKLKSKIKTVNETDSVADLPHQAKRRKLTRSSESQQSDNEQPTTLDMTKSESISTSSKPLEISVKSEDCKTIIETNTENNDQKERNYKEEENKIATAGGSSMSDLTAPPAMTEKAECSPNDVIARNISTDESKQNEEPPNGSKKHSDAENKDEKKMPVKKVRPDRPARRSIRLQENSPSNAKNDAVNCTAIVHSASSNSKKSPAKKENSRAKQQAFVKQFDNTNCSLPDTPILSLFNKFLSEEVKTSQRNCEYLKNNEKRIREQLTSLMTAEPLTTDVFLQISDNLSSVTPLDVVALVLVEYACTEYSEDVKCNTTYTPPAPPMTKFEQKLITLIVLMKEKHPEFLDTVEKGLQYKLFRLGRGQEVQIVERLFRILAVLNKIKKDREKVRMLFCDALYCFNTRAVNIIYVTLSCWSEAFPKHDSNNDILVKTIVHIIMSANVNRPFSKLMPLKKLLSDYYGYPNSGFRVENFKEELMDNLKKNVPGINTAIILLCKSKGPEWTFENIIKNLKKMIVSQAHPSMYDALTLLGNLLRPFPPDQFKSILEQITDQLCEVLTGNTGSHDLEEGIVSCLLNIGGKFTFNREKIARCVLKWHPIQDLRQTTKEKFNSFLKTGTGQWWRKFIRQNFPTAEKH